MNSIRFHALAVVALTALPFASAEARLTYTSGGQYNCTYTCTNAGPGQPQGGSVTAASYSACCDAADKTCGKENYHVGYQPGGTDPAQFAEIIRVDLSPRESLK